MKQSEEVADDLILYYLHVCTKPYFDDSTWQNFGFSNGRPKHGKLIEKLAPKKFVYENFILRALFFMSLTDIVASIKQSSHSSTAKHMVIVGILDKLLLTNTFDENFLDDFITFCETYLEYKDDSIQASLIKEAQGQLNEKDLAHYAVGILKIMPNPNPDNLILDIPTMTKHIDNVDLSNARTDLSMGANYYAKYDSRLLQLIS